MENKLLWDEVVEKYGNLVKYASGEVYKKYKNILAMDASIRPDDLYQVGMITLYKCWEKYSDRDMQEFGKLFKTAMWNSMNDTCTARKRHLYESLDDLHESAGDFIQDNSFQHMEDVETLMVMEVWVDKLKTVLTPYSKAILLELMNPSPKTLMAAWAQDARKAHISETQTHKKVYYARSRDIKPKHIRESLGLTVSEYEKYIKELREKTTQVLNDTALV